MVAMRESELATIRRESLKNHAVGPLAVVGCVDYLFISSDEDHQTGIIFDLVRNSPSPDAGFAIDLNNVALQPSEIDLRFNIMGTGPAN
jgi:hypothetical protein